jgi:cysteine desulfuration protein SufE
MNELPTLNEVQDTFAILDDWEDRYAYIIDLGRTLPVFPDDQKTEVNLVKGCTSQVWMVLNDDNGHLSVRADSDAHIVRGLIALVVITYDGHSIDDIQSIDMDQIFNDLGLSDHISPNRRNGFFSMVERVNRFG